MLYEVICLRFGLDNGQPLTLAKIGVRLNISRERVRQMLAPSVAGTTYLLTILATTSNGRTLPGVCVVPVRNP